LLRELQERFAAHLTSAAPGKPVNEMRPADDISSAQIAL
jgi:hypothetical protein